MNEIKCPHCGQVFKVDESAFSDILRQVRTQEFDKEIHSQLAAIEKQNKAEQELAIAKERQSLQDQLNSKQNELEQLQQQLKSTIENAKTQQDLEVTKATSELEKQNSDLLSKLQIAQAQAKEQEASWNEKLTSQKKATEDILRLKDEELARVKEMKLQFDNKTIGEDLEQHCLTEFNKVRAMAFPNAYFGKDNETVKSEDDGKKKGTKGDFIFREVDKETGAELISIMFEMKNEKEDSTHKQTNESFFNKLDEDRKKKNCEYAILCTTLEADNELYNQGIVDVSYKYEKMFVIRPQFFIPIISLLRNAALASFEDKKQLAIEKSKNIDITNFEEQIDNFKKGFAYNYTQASKRFEVAIKDIDATIKKLEETKKALTSCDTQLRRANDKCEDLTIKKLTRGNPTMKAMFADLKKD